MDIVENYLYFKRKWLVKLIYQVSSLYDTPLDNLKWEKDIDEFLEDCIDGYLQDLTISDEILSESVFEIDENLLNQIDINLFKIVLSTFNKPKYIMSNYNFLNLIFITILLESTIDIYRLSFETLRKDEVEDILENNIIGLSFIKYKKKSRKLNLIYSYLEYLNKKQNEIFSLLKKDDLRVNFIKLINEISTYITNYDFRITDLANYDDDIVNEVYEDKLADKRLVLITYKLLRLNILLNNEINGEKIDKVLYVLNEGVVDNKVLKEINGCSINKEVNNKILLVSNNLNKTYKTKLDMAYYLKDNKKIKAVSILKDKRIVVNKSFWNKNKKDEKRFIENNVKFITINDNINYLFERKEVRS